MNGRVRGLRDRLEGELLRGHAGAKVRGGAGPRLANTSMITWPGADGAALVAELDGRGIMLSAAAACGTHERKPSAVLLAMGCTPGEAHGSLRFSLSTDTRVEEIERAIEAVGQALGGGREAGEESTDLIARHAVPVGRGADGRVGASSVTYPIAVQIGVDANQIARAIGIECGRVHDPLGHAPILASEDELLEALQACFQRTDVGVGTR
jgi:hypothetical protein